MAVQLPSSFDFGAQLPRSVHPLALHIEASLLRAFLLSSSLVASVPFLSDRISLFFSSSSSLMLLIRAKLRIMCLSTVLASSPVLCGRSILRECAAFAAAQRCSNTLAACLAICPTCALAVSCSSGSSAVTILVFTVSAKSPRNLFLLLEKTVTTPSKFCFQAFLLNTVWPSSYDEAIVSLCLFPPVLHA